MQLVWLIGEPAGSGREPFLLGGGHIYSESRGTHG